MFLSWYEGFSDVQDYKIDVVVMGSDWADSDRFDYLKEYCELTFLPRTEGISTTKIKEDLGLQEPKNNENQIPEPKQKVKSKFNK